MMFYVKRRWVTIVLSKDSLDYLIVRVFGRGMPGAPREEHGLKVARSARTLFIHACMHASYVHIQLMAFTNKVTTSNNAQPYAVCININGIFFRWDKCSIWKSEDFSMVYFGQVNSN